jgi:hypothetical protein
VVQTEVCEAEKLVSLLYTGLKMARPKNSFGTEFSQKPIYKLVEGKTYVFPRVLQTSENKRYSWMQLHFMVSMAIAFGGRDMCTMLLGFWVKGSTSNVYQAIDSNGRVVP